MRLEVLFISITIIVLSGKITGEQWDYNKFGPEVWGKTWANCDGQNQSPVNIQTGCTVLQDFQPFQFESIYNQKMNVTLTNDGHTVRATVKNIILPLSGGNLNGNYQFHDLHLHWGPNENVGSEHQINGVKYTGESHFVYENNETKALAVLAFFMKSESKLIDQNNPIDNQHKYAAMNEWKKYFDATQNLNKTNDSIIIDLNLSLLMGNNTNDFWRYSGSLTTPPCSENVIWTVFKEPIYISNYEFETFRDDIFFESFRGPQPLYYRTIYRSFQTEIISPIPDQRCCINEAKSKASPVFLHKFFIFIYFISFIYSF